MRTTDEIRAYLAEQLRELAQTRAELRELLLRYEQGDADSSMFDDPRLTRLTHDAPLIQRDIRMLRWMLGELDSPDDCC